MANPKKNATNPAFRSKYANLEELLAQTRPILAAVDLALVQEPVSEDGSIGVHSYLVHKSGETLDFGHYTVPLAKHDAQGAGSVLTYTRRYAIAAIFGLAQEDDDGEAASKPRPRREGKPQAAVKTADAKTLAKIHALRDELGIDAEKYLAQLRAVAKHDIASDAELSQEAAEKLLDAYEAKVATAKLADDLGAEVSE
jgi:hypothetical protein